jgi:hypothetical protein
VIDRVRTILQDENLFKRLGIVHEISGVSASTLHNWFHGDTRNPQHHTVAAVVTSLGYQEQFVKAKEIDIDKEIEVARAWLAKQKNGNKRKKR